MHESGAMRAAWFKDPDGNILAIVSGEVSGGLSAGSPRHLAPVALSLGAAVLAALGVCLLGRPFPGQDHLRDREQAPAPVPVTGVDAEHVADGQVVLGPAPRRFESRPLRRYTASPSDTMRRYAPWTQRRREAAQKRLLSSSCAHRGASTERAASRTPPAPRSRSPIVRPPAADRSTPSMVRFSRTGVGRRSTDPPAPASGILERVGVDRFVGAAVRLAFRWRRRRVHAAEGRRGRRPALPDRAAGGFSPRAAVVLKLTGAPPTAAEKRPRVHPLDGRASRITFWRAFRRCPLAPLPSSVSRDRPVCFNLIASSLDST